MSFAASSGKGVFLNPRYAPGGDIYAAINTDFGRVWADRAYSASMRDDDGTELRNVLNDARQTARGADLANPGSDSTWSNFFEQVTSDPLSAPLDGLNSQLGKAAWNVVKNPFVLLLVLGLGYFFVWPKIKRLLPALLLALALPVTCLAGQVNLAWNPSPTPGVTNYILYAHTNALAETNLHLAAVKISTGTNATTSLLFTVPGRWHFRATAIASGVESEPSNQIIVESPAAPAALRTIAIEHGTILAGTNWTDVGFFRLRLQ